jgi:hypothetical protein
VISKESCNDGTKERGYKCITMDVMTSLAKKKDLDLKHYAMLSKNLSNK